MPEQLPEQCGAQPHHVRAFLNSNTVIAAHTHAQFQLTCIPIPAQASTRETIPQVAQGAETGARITVFGRHAHQAMNLKRRNIHQLVKKNRHSRHVRTMLMRHFSHIDLYHDWKFPAPNMRRNSLCRFDIFHTMPLKSVPTDIFCLVFLQGSDHVPMHARKPQRPISQALWPGFSKVRLTCVHQASHRLVRRIFGYRQQANTGMFKLGTQYLPALK